MMNIIELAKEAGVTEASQTPLKDLLRAVPKDGVAMYEEDKFCHHNIPYGRLINEALAEIERLERFVALVRAEALANHSGDANEMVAEPVKQEPVAWMYEQTHIFLQNVKPVCYVERVIDPPKSWVEVPLYAAPVDAKAIRAEALEEAAKVCDGYDSFYAEYCAAAIRGLK